MVVVFRKEIGNIPSCKRPLLSS